MPDTSPGALDGLRVIELDGDGSGALAGKLMAGQGADVLKVEAPCGDPLRHAGPFVDDLSHPDRSLSFWHYNTGKRSLTLDLDLPPARDILRSLLLTADVLLETLPPSRLEELGLAPEVLLAVNPGLVVTRFTPYGQDGPWRDYLGTDLTLLASGGELYLCGYEDHSIPPIRPAINHAWHIGAHYALIGTLLALLERQASGHGQVVDLACHDAIANSLELVTPGYFMAGEVLERQDGRYAMPRRTTTTQARAADGRYVSFYLTPNNRTWNSLVEWMARTGHEAFLADAGYQDYRQRYLDMERIFEVIIEFIASMPAEEVYTGAQEMGLPWGVVRSPEEAVEDEHSRSRGSLLPVEHPDLGRSILYPGPPALLSDTPFHLRRPPLLGEHTREALLELGYAEEEIGRLRESGVI